MRVKARKTYGKHVERLSTGRNIVKVTDVGGALNLYKWINNNSLGHNIVIEPIAPYEWGLTWRQRPPKKVGESRHWLFFDFDFDL